MKSPTTPRRSAALNVETLEGRDLPASLIPGGIVSGSIAQSGEVDEWTFTGNAGDRIELITTSTPTQAGFTAYADVYGPSGTHAAGFWPGNNVILTLAETGTYTVALRDDNRLQTGGYTVGLEGLNPISPGAVSLVKGGIVSGTIDARTGKDQWTFAGGLGQRVELISTSTPTQAGFTAFLDVYGPSGERVAGFWPGNNVVLNLEETGTYMVQVRDDNYAETGKYTIGFEGPNPISPLPAAIKKGGIVSGEIGARTEKDQWTFAGVEGQRVELISTSAATRAGFTAFLDVYGPSGERVAGFWPGNNVVLNLEETGTYMVQVRDDNYAETGKYTIGFESLNPRSPDAKALTHNVQKSGSIGAATKKDQWFIRVPEGKRLRLILAGTAVTPGFRAYANIFDASGERVGGMWAGNQVFTLGAGVYLIQVSDAALTKRGTYRLTARVV